MFCNDTIRKDEEYRPVIIHGEEYPSYLVSNYGNLFNQKRNKFVKGYRNSKGYIDFDLYKNGKRKHMKAHRLVAYSFIDNPENLNIINHIDEQRDNNHVENLEWCTQAYNLNYGDAQKRKAEKLSKPVIQVDSEFNLVDEYPSLTDTSKQTGIPLVSLFRACTYGIPQRDYFFAYASKE